MLSASTKAVMDAIDTPDPDDRVRLLDAELTKARAERSAVEDALAAAEAAKAAAERTDDEHATVAATREVFRVKRERAALDGRIADLEAERMEAAQACVKGEETALEAERAAMECALASTAARLTEYEQRLLALRTRKNDLGLPLAGLAHIPQRITRRMLLDHFEQFGIVVPFNAGKPRPSATGFAGRS